ncbi:phosphoglycerate mutase-like protein [Lentinus tigrinus ALCF2SS1-6]|uniref:Phosphoglycerate mutase-like protein n=1 Tax=Lentinus tigrinus ALCF2SS1-6 TaxID=1328759 RepID=A0A5C2SEM8_9APHY|nr:phosphoglycerate mutase-like protein [Lentinus tigrinus ALCF2SS1-6]
MVNASTLLGIVLLARHGDRLEFFQDPLTYDPAETFLTPLGSVQEQQLGQFLRSTYLDPASPTFINGVQTEIADINQLIVRADAAGEGSVILNSVQGLLQGLYPPTSDNNITLANGTTVIAPLGGYQYIPVESVEPNEDISLNSFTSCPVFDNHISAFYSSAPFLAEAQEAQPFLEQLQPFLDNRSIDFTNMIFDFVNVQSIHNATFLQELPDTFAEQAYFFANFHENGVFTDPSPSGIGNIAIRTVLPSIFTSLTRIANTSDTLKIALNEISYKPFISFFNVTEATTADPSLAGIVDYASVMALELHGDGTSEPTVNARFKNGTTDASLHDITLFGQQSVPLSQFISALAGSAVNSTQQWCTVCNQTTLRGCSVFQ